MSHSNKQSVNYIAKIYEEQENHDYPVNIYYVDFPEMFMKSVRHHWHEKMEIDYIKSGSVLFDVGEKEILCQSGDAIIINSGQIHSAKPESDNAVIISILFSPDYLFSSEEQFLTIKYRNPIVSNTDFSFILFERDIHVDVLNCIQSIFSQNLNKSYGYELVTKSLLCNLWLSLLSANSRTEKKTTSLSIADTERVKEAILYIHENYNRNITLNDIADSIHISKSECCRCFKRATHLTPFEYLMRHRIYESAIKMQRSDKLFMNSLADSVGFNNASYYNKIFKKYLGITPSEYRLSIKKSHRDALNPYGIPM